ncbi:hypothetical protein A6R68_22848 [Neotoma lepida]|uniref:Uncharacterized protein n=1 Tax=Neotoma lepida TaxID=56216 RepID=A0A1A6HY39_NEOLE|nr:hypothetical protein A6R68_22848 [Neotoma lepida]
MDNFCVNVQLRGMDLDQPQDLVILPEVAGIKAGMYNSKTFNQYDFTHSKFHSTGRTEKGKLTIGKNKILPTSNGVMLIPNMLWSLLVSSPPWRSGPK